ncbi:PepSY-associated TM helix domain-containing protein [Tardiphaga sp. 42S5]|uniref:PepSY-associated TM helix domain-containing protein n=1 Tax=Tardiphaga sp. 42S5 TaxID=1404799 RepID=UPI002A5A42AD|nr:PepSY-associated TM helix domain-containing protein [Tardiphaga sp. 42S5]WPO40323.1 PepSY-associated TM helix domain-containing protein [Tardiphaga sp. 42S5]
MDSTFRASMSRLHTWAGVTVGALLFAIFWMGTLAVFDREIDRWMMPETRLASPSGQMSLDRTIVPLLVTLPSVGTPTSWHVVLPSNRSPFMQFRYDGPGGVQQIYLVDTSGRVLNSGSLGGTGFINPFHYSLHLKAKGIGFWIVGFAGMAMLALLVSGVIIHPRIFLDFFTMRTMKPTRLFLDLHNLTGVLGLPFHIAITLSGLIAFFAIYYPAAINATYSGGINAFYSEAYGDFSRPAAHIGGPLTSLDRMADEASRRWGGRKISAVSIRHYGDTEAYVRLASSSEGTVAKNFDSITFDGATGSVLSQHVAPPIMQSQRFISGFHFIQFTHWTLRWIYFLLGLSGCVLIATGFSFWLEARKKQHDGGDNGYRIVRCLAVASITGIIIATISFFVANRLLPTPFSAKHLDRSALEVWVFYLVWLLALGDAWLRPVQVWSRHCWAIALLASVAVSLNWITTGDHIARTTLDRSLWPVAGMDLMLLVGAILAARIAQTLQRQARLASAARSG